MAKQIEGVYDRILECAKEEFLDKGYVDASLREIARNADTSTGSIYTRFGGKEGLYEALVEPAAKQMKQVFTEVQEEFQQLGKTEQIKVLPEYTNQGNEQIFEMIYDHFDEFCLLMDASYGTRFQNFIEELVQIEVDYTYKYMDTIGCETVRSGEVTEELLHIVVHGYFNAIFEVVRHQMKKEEAACYVRMLQKYHMAGFDTIFYPEKY